MHVTLERGRITARVSQPIAEKLQEAADLSGATLNQFLVQAALEKAQKVIDHERLIQLTLQDAELLIDLLEHPPKPNEALLQGFEEYASGGGNSALRRITE